MMATASACATDRPDETTRFTPPATHKPLDSSTTMAPNGPPVRSVTLRRAISIAKCIRSASEEPGGCNWPLSNVASQAGNCRVALIGYLSMFRCAGCSKQETNAAAQIHNRPGRRQPTLAIPDEVLANVQ